MALAVGSICLAGCQSRTTADSPFRLIDTYLEYLTPAEKDAWLSSIDSRGMDATMRDLPLPQSVWYATCNAYGAKTPKGTLAEAEYITFVRNGAEVTERLRSLARSPVCDGTAEAASSEAPHLNPEDNTSE